MDHHYDIDCDCFYCEETTEYRREHRHDGLDKNDPEHGLMLMWESIADDAGQEREHFYRD